MHAWRAEVTIRMAGDRRLGIELLAIRSVNTQAVLRRSTGSKQTCEDCSRLAV